MVAGRIWFSRWIRWYGQFRGADYRQPIPVQRERGIGFLRQQKANGRKAWQRLQAVRAIEFYRQRLLQNGGDNLDDIRIRLQEMAGRESRTDATQEASVRMDVAGKIDPS